MIQLIEANDGSLYLWDTAGRTGYDVSAIADDATAISDMSAMLDGDTASWTVPALEPGIAHSSQLGTVIAELTPDHLSVTLGHIGLAGRAYLGLPRPS